MQKPATPATATRKTTPPSTTRYEMFANALVAEIASGAYPVGSLLPPEPELCVQYGLSRHTVREGVRKLVQMGLVTRHQGIGTRVVSSEVAPQDFAALTSLKALLSYVKETYLKILDERWVTADEALARTLDCKPGQRWLQVTTCRYKQNDKRPLSHTVLYIPPAFEGIRPYLPEFNHPVYQLIEEHYGHKVRDLQMVITAMTISPEVANWLDCEPNSPGLHVVRRYRGANDALLSISVGIYPPERFEVSIHYRLNWTGV